MMAAFSKERNVMSMSCLGNLIWMIFGGLLGAISWFWPVVCGV